MIILPQMPHISRLISENGALSFTILVEILLLISICSVSVEFQVVDKTMFIDLMRIS